MINDHREVTQIAFLGPVDRVLHSSQAELAEIERTHKMNVASYVGKVR